MRIVYYQINAFTSMDFAGNPAGVCLLQDWLPDTLLQQIAAENDLSETAFLLKRNGFYDLRWMTPASEVDLCGHATLAAAFVLFFEKRVAETQIAFQTRSGRLTASRRNDSVELDFPARPPSKCDDLAQVATALGIQPAAVLKARDYLAVYRSAREVSSLNPDMKLLAELEALGTIATAPGDGDVDFVSRFFAPKVGVPEDPVTGSAHCSLIPYWAERLGKTTLQARQISRRGGELSCRMLGDRVGIAGRAVVYCRGELSVAERKSDPEP